jgi:hypothetical protein
MFSVLQITSVFRWPMGGQNPSYSIGLTGWASLNLVLALRHIAFRIFKKPKLQVENRVVSPICLAATGHINLLTVWRFVTMIDLLHQNYVGHCPLSEDI